jgi:hypothetical protein
MTGRVLQTGRKLYGSAVIATMLRGQRGGPA